MPAGILKIWRLSSIDIVLGATGCSYMAVRFYETSLPAGWWILLPLSVWIIYTFDHLADSYLPAAHGADERYRWYARHRPFLKGFLALQLAGWLVACIFYFDARILFFGGLLLLPVGGYFWQYLRKSGHRFIYKELLIAIIYTGVVGGYPLFVSGSARFSDLHFLCILFLLVCGNVLFFSMLEMETDREAHRSSFAVFYGKPASKVAGILLVAGAFLLSLYMALFYEGTIQRQTGVILCCMSMLQVLLYLAAGRFRENSGPGLLADLLFLLPWILVFIAP